MKNTIADKILSKKAMLNKKPNKCLRPNNKCAWNAQQGAVLMEFIVIVGLVLIPLFIGLTFIGKYTDNAQKIEIAARYSAWERTAWYQKLPASLKKANSNINTKKSAAELGFELENRVFANSNSGIYLSQKTNTVNEDDDPMTKSYWVDNKGKRISLYKKSTKPKKSSTKSDQFVTVTDGKQAKMYGYSSGLLKKFFKAIDKINGFDIDMGGAMSTKVNLTLVQPEFLKNYTSGDIAVSRSQTILADGWNAAGPKHAKTRAQGLVATALFESSALTKAQKILGSLFITEELSGNSLIMGHVVVDAVPESRLKKYKYK